MKIKYQSGFVDYSTAYSSEISVLGICLGTFLIVGSAVSIIPQLISYVKARSNYGVSAITLFLISFGQFALVLNYIILNPLDFLAFPCSTFKQIYPHFMAFLTFVALWYTFLGTAFMNFIFFDNHQRAKRTAADIRRDRVINLVVTFLLFGGDFLILIVYYFTAMGGFISVATDSYGIILGLICSGISFVQYLPQIYTTCKLRGPGALSLAMLLMQAPGGLANVYLIAFVNKKNWSTWLPIFVAACQQILLICIIIFFKCTKKDYSHLSDSLLDSTDPSTRN